MGINSDVKLSETLSCAHDEECSNQPSNNCSEECQNHEDTQYSGDRCGMCMMSDQRGYKTLLKIN